MGTHLETPTVFGGAGGNIEAVAAAQLVLATRVIDAPPVLRARDDDGTAMSATVGIPRLLAHEAQFGTIPTGSAVLLRTGEGERSSIELARSGTQASADVTHAGWSAEAIRFLANERGVRLVGTDALIVDAADAAKEAPAARAAAESGLLTLQTLANLGALPRHGAVLVIGVLPVTGARAAPARVLALVPPERGDDRPSPGLSKSEPTTP